MSAIMDRVEAVRPYWDAYWRGEIPMLNAAVPKDRGRVVAKPALGITAETDIDVLADSLLQWAGSNEFLGGALPFYCVYLFDIYNLPAACLGGEVVDAGSNCYHMIPFIDDLDAAELELDLNCGVLKRIESIVARLKERCGNDILISASAVGGNLDALEAARGSTDLLMDLYDNPAGVHRCLLQMDDVSSKILDYFSELYHFETFGSVCRHGLYSRGRIGVPQCDFGYMIGPDSFAEFAMPYLRREFARLDGVCYHLDGVGNLPNLEILCAESNLHLIQWVPGTGHDGKDWTSVFEDADKLGKGSLNGGTVAGFEKWYETHKASWQCWNIYVESVDEFLACLKNLGVKGD
ncbi:MAG: hypothetical protein KAG97_01195 [Victivallales bacterium]|nr:hypothetical protein [Victivallales bacterium]